LTATVVSGALALSGVICIGLALTHQEHPSEPELSEAAAATPYSHPTATRPRPSAAATPGTRAALLASRLANTSGTVGPLLPRSTPLSLSIPAIGVRSPLLRLGLTPDGALEVPPHGPYYDEAGWYRHSPTPGSLGPAVIAGHVDSATGPSLFFNLGSLRPRDSVLVRRADGTVAVFEVDDVRRYPKANFPTELVYGNTRHAALRLITCGGPIDQATGHHRDNIIVLASLVRVDGSN
jgi:sortase (surface protein transpeptidase)